MIILVYGGRWKKLFAITKTSKGFEVDDYAVYTTDDSVIFASVCYVGNKLCCFTSNALYEVQNDVLSRMNFDFSAVGYVKKVGNNLFVTYADGISQYNSMIIVPATAEYSDGGEK